jgi:hypothetical protein
VLQCLDIAASCQPRCIIRQKGELQGASQKPVPHGKKLVKSSTLSTVIIAVVQVQGGRLEGKLSLDLVPTFAHQCNCIGPAAEKIRIFEPCGPTSHSGFGVRHF